MISGIVHPYITVRNDFCTCSTHFVQEMICTHARVPLICLKEVPEIAIVRTSVM